MLEQNLALHEQMTKLTGLRYPGVAIRFLTDETEIPENAVVPLRDWGRHIAVCQAFAYARRQGMTLYMRKEDHWCWCPILTYGMISRELGKEGFRAIHRVQGTSMESADAFVDSFPFLPYQENKGMLIAPLDKADFVPDVTLIYCKNDQLRVFLMAIGTQTKSMLDSSFTAMDSCAYSVVPAILEGKYRITIPDPGEYERGLTPEDDIILSVPAQRMEEFARGLTVQTRIGGRDHFYMTMKEEFPRPPMYNVIFETWGLQTGEDWAKK